jgi:hypothetical protein
MKIRAPRPAFTGTLAEAAGVRSSQAAAPEPDVEAEPVEEHPSPVGER